MLREITLWQALMCMADLGSHPTEAENILAYNYPTGERLKYSCKARELVISYYHGNEVLPGIFAKPPLWLMTSVFIAELSAFLYQLEESVMLEFLVVGAGGFFGSCLRYGITRLSAVFSISLPMGTLISNIIAGFFIGFILGIERQSTAISERAKLFLTTGLLGGLSTFSTFSIETVDLFRTEKYMLAVGNIALNVVLSFALVALGMAMAKLITRAHEA